DLLHQRLDVRAEELRRAMARRADQMKVARVAVRRLEARAPLAEVHFARHPGADHPLQRAVDRGAPHARRFPADDLDEIVGAEMPFLLQKDLEDAIALGRTLPARRADGVEIGKGTVHRNW